MNKGRFFFIKDLGGGKKGTNVDKENRYLLWRRQKGGEARGTN